MQDKLDPQVKIIAQVITERKRQDMQWGGATHDDEHDSREWFAFITEQREKCYQVVIQALNQQDWGNIPSAQAEEIIRKESRERLIKIAALTVAAVESLDRKSDNGNN